MDTTQTTQASTPGQDKPRRRFIRRVAIATAIAGLAAGIGIKTYAYGHGGWQRGGFMGAAIDPAMMDEHLDRMLKHLYVEIDATEAQKQQLAPIVKAAAHDLLPMRTQFQDARRQAIDLLSRERVDRAALELGAHERLGAGSPGSSSATPSSGEDACAYSRRGILPASRAS